MSTLQERINFAFDKLPDEKRNQAKMAAFCGVKPPSANGWFTGGSKSMKASTLAKAAEYLNVSEKWLRDGTGSMLRLDSNIGQASQGGRNVPVLNYVQAGHLTDLGHNFCYEDVEHLPTNSKLSDRSFALELRGDSMLPEFSEGDIVIIDCDLSPQPGDFVVATNGGNEATFKRYRLISTGAVDIFELVPLNENYPTMRSDTNQIQVIGVMVEHRKFRKRK